jgi:hypothetical protein
MAVALHLESAADGEDAGRWRQSLPDEPTRGAYHLPPSGCPVLTRSVEAEKARAQTDDEGRADKETANAGRTSLPLTPNRNGGRRRTVLPHESMV